MRTARALALTSVLVGSLGACSGDPEEGSGSEPASFGRSSSADLPGAGDGGASAGDGATTPTPQPGKVLQPTGSHPEVVYVLMDGKDGLTWFCTGALVSRTVVVTAAHCLQDALFASWEVVAPWVQTEPRVAAKSVAMYERDWEDIANPDLGIVRLSAPIDLPSYAKLTDVTARVDAGKQTYGAAIVRQAEEPEAPLEQTPAMKLSSTISLGYAHGYGVPLFSHGGDSGAGVFLVENGLVSHQLIAVERQPEPSRKLDHLTRIEPAFVEWVAKHGGS